MSFSFGSKTPQAPTFGATPTGSITFGTPVAQPTTTQFGFTSSPFSPPQQTPVWNNSQNLPHPYPLCTQIILTCGNPTSTTLTLGSQSTAPTFGTPATKSQLPNLFGTPLATTSAGFTLGGLGTSFNTSSAGTGLSFGTPTTASAGFTLGTPASSASLSFNTQPTQSTGGLFGSTPAPSTGLSFGTSQNLGLTSTTTTAPTLGLSFGTTTTAAPTINWGLSAPATTTSGSLFSSLSGPATTATSLFTGLGGSFMKSSSASPSTFTSTTATPNVGLGGVTSAQKPATTTANEVLPREQPLPNEILQTVEGFKGFVKQQKGCSSEVARCSVKEFRAVEADIDRVNKLLKEVELELQKNRGLAEKLKYDTARGLNHADIAQRTFNTPPGLQYTNVEPMNFFTDLADAYERTIQEMKNQIENTGVYVKSLKDPTPLTPQDLALGMRRLHETFVALAGRLQGAHNSVEEQKEQYLNFRKYVLHDDTNVFEKVTKQPHPNPTQTLIYSPPKLMSGPTPFNNLTTTSYALTNTQNAPPAYPGQSSFGGLPWFQQGNVNTSMAPPFGAQNTQGSLFGQSSLFNSPSSSFQLQKPPAGNKRGKLTA